MHVKEPFQLKSNQKNDTHNSLLFLEPWQSKWPYLSAGFTTRFGGVSRKPFASLNTSFHVGDFASDVITNRQLIAEWAGFDHTVWTCAQQVHGTNITHVSKVLIGSGNLSSSSEIPQSDVLFTQEKNVMLVSFYADCVPLYFFDPIHQVIGLAHAGWKGTWHKICQIAIHEMIKTYGTSLDQLYCAIGPSIGGCCYEIGDDLIEQFSLKFSKIDAYISVQDTSKSLDLKQLNYDLLCEVGIPQDHILQTNYCTSCRNDLFYSYRRELGQTGRMISWIGFKN